MGDRITAPFTEEQTVSLNRFQQAGRVHPFTCPIDLALPLVATINGWECPVDLCGYTQDWAHSFMLVDPDVGMDWSEHQAKGKI